MFKIQIKSNDGDLWFDCPGEYQPANSTTLPAFYNTYSAALEAKKSRAEHWSQSVDKYRVVDLDRVPDCTEKKLDKPDMVDAPEHYTRLDPQPIEVIEAWNLDFFTGSAIKYIARAGFKQGEEATTDLRKAVSFLNRKIASLQGKSVTHEAQ